jgi:hypothetical protein
VQPLSKHRPICEQRLQKPVPECSLHRSRAPPPLPRHVNTPLCLQRTYLTVTFAVPMSPLVLNLTASLVVEMSTVSPMVARSFTMRA